MSTALSPLRYENGTAVSTVESPANGRVRPSPLEVLAERLETTRARIGVIGLGYVGLPLAVEFAKAGFSVTGIDVDEGRVTQIHEGSSYIPDVDTATIAALRHAQRLEATTSYEILPQLDVIVICVPTPLRKTRDPDISFILAAVQHIATWLRPGQLVVLESTTYPGTTEEALLPVLEHTGLRAGHDFGLAFSPERIDPGNSRFSVNRIPKVVGGITPICRDLTMQLYRRIIAQVVPVSSPKTAEMVKLLENTFRAVNIGLANEMAMMCDALGVDVWEVIEAAKTKPFGFMAFYPGPGIGGHCIPSDPIYLAWKARLHGCEPRFIELADQTNRGMPQYVVDKISRALNDRKKPLKDASILLVGIAYKPDLSDTRDSPAFDVARLLAERGARLSYHDPYVPTAALNGTLGHSVSLNSDGLQDTDCVVILTNHSTVNYDQILRHASLIVDTRHHYRFAHQTPEHVVRL